jgi:hypothetical protein
MQELNCAGNKETEKRKAWTCEAINKKEKGNGRRETQGNNVGRKIKEQEMNKWRNNEKEN